MVIFTLQHESSTRTVDNNVWDEIRNFKKCLIMMFAKQEKEVVFLETVMGLAQQRRHCLVECIPVPEKIAKQAPLYFKKVMFLSFLSLSLYMYICVCVFHVLLACPNIYKFPSIVMFSTKCIWPHALFFCMNCSSFVYSIQKSERSFLQAIDEAEDEWSQHNAKKLIDTSVKGLRGSIPKDFPYFHVEFGLNKGFVHVIDDEKQFKSNLGLNVIRGMLQLPEEDMYRRRKHESVEAQKQAVAEFARDWEPFDWTKQLG